MARWPAERDAIIVELYRLRAEGFLLVPDREAPATAVQVGSAVWFDPTRMEPELLAALRKIDTATPQKCLDEPHNTVILAEMEPNNAAPPLTAANLACYDCGALGPCDHDPPRRAERLTPASRPVRPWPSGLPYANERCLCGLRDLGDCDCSEVVS